MATKNTKIPGDARFTTINDNVMFDDTRQSDDITVVDELDSDWVRSTFQVPGIDLDKIDADFRYFTSASLRTVDTTLGGNVAINARPQYTRYSDIRQKGRLKNRRDVKVIDNKGHYGIGRYYDESIQANVQTVHLEFGVVEYTGLLRFFSLALDANSSYTANTGKISMTYWAGKAVGMYLGVRINPILGSLYLVKQVLDIYYPLYVASSQFYTLKPTPHLYWSTVSSLATDIAVELDIFKSEFVSNKGDLPNPGDVEHDRKVDEDTWDLLTQMYPMIYQENGRIDVMAIANRAKVIANAQQKKEFEALNDPNADIESLRRAFGYADVDPLDLPDGKHTIGELMDQYSKIEVQGEKFNYFKSKYISPTIDEIETMAFDMIDEVKAKIQDTTIDDVIEGATSLGEKAVGVVTDLMSSIDGEAFNDKKEKPKNRLKESYLRQAAQFFDATTHLGANFASFNVDYVGTVSESVSTSVKDNPVISVMNSTSSGMRTTKFSLAGGTLVGGMIEDLGRSIVGGIKNMALGVADGLTMGISNVVVALLGGGYINAQKQWEDSTVDLPKVSYKISLVSPYGNPISLYQNIYLPMAMLMAGAFPLATGKQSYTSPFICSLFHRGVQKISTGIITDLSFTRGTTNVGFTEDGRPLGVDVTFSVLDLSSIITMPISQGGFFGVDTTLDQDHPLNSYISTITGRDMFSQRFLSERGKRAIIKKAFDRDAAWSPSNIGMMVGDSFVGALPALFARMSNQNNLRR